MSIQFRLLEGGGGGAYQHVKGYIKQLVIFQGGLGPNSLLRGFAGTPSPPSVFKYPMKMRSFGLSETKLSHVHGIFKKNEIKLAKRTYTFIHTNPLSRNPRSAPEIRSCTDHCQANHAHRFYLKQF